MGAIRKYRLGSSFSSPHDDLASWFWEPVIASWTNNYYTNKGTWVDTEMFDITPKKEYRKQMIEAKQKEIERLEENKKQIEREIKELES